MNMEDLSKLLENRCTSEHIKVILKNQRILDDKTIKYDTSIAKNSILLDDFYNYIGFEFYLWDVYGERKDIEATDDSEDSKIKSIFVNKISDLYLKATSHFVADIDLWKKSIDFFRQHNDSEVFNILDQMFNFHTRYSDLWILASIIAFEKRIDPSVATSYLERGLKYLPDSESLHLSLFELDLKFAECTDGFMNVKEIEKGTRQEYICRAISHMKDALSINDEFEFINKFLEISLKFSFTEEVDMEILKYLRNHINSEFAWCKMAEQILNRSIVHNDTEASIQSIQAFLDIYEIAVKQLPTDLMCDLYVENIKNLYDKNVLTGWQLHESFKRVHYAAFKECHYEIWIKLMKLIDESASVPVLKEALVKFPLSTALWLHLINNGIEKKLKHEYVMRTFDEAVNTLKSQSLPIYFNLIRIYALYGKCRIVMEIYERGIRESFEVSSVLRPQYLEHLGLYGDYRNILTKYNQMAQMKPYCFELHEKMLEILKFMPDIDLNSVHMVHENICEQFGMNRIDIWIEYLRLVPTKEKRMVIRAKAENYLNKDLIKNFRQQCAVFFESDI